MSEAVIGEKQVYVPQKIVQSPTSMLYEIFSQKELRPSFTFSNYPLVSSSVQQDKSVWSCTVTVPKHGNGRGSSYCKKTAKSRACVDILAKLGHDVSKFNYLDTLSNDLPHRPSEKLEQPKEIQCFNLCCLVKNTKVDPDGELKPQFFRLYRAIISKEIGEKYKTLRELNPHGYLEMLCKMIDCQLPTFVCELRDASFVTTAKLGPWTASGFAPNKKYSRYIAFSSLINGIESMKDIDNRTC